MGFGVGHAEFDYERLLDALLLDEGLILLGFGNCVEQLDRLCAEDWLTR